MEFEFYKAKVQDSLKKNYKVKKEVVKMMFKGGMLKQNAVILFSSLFGKGYQKRGSNRHNQWLYPYRNQFSMSKTSTTSKPLSIFSLMRFRKECFFAPISVDFTPIVRANQPSQPILPKFNQDQLFYTPAFVNPYDQSRVTSLSTSFLQKQREKFQRKVQCNLSAPEEENISFNPRDDLFCSMCQVSFESYWTHINSKAHLRKIKSSKANKYIHQFCDSYKKNRKNPQLSEDRKSSPCSKKKRISKNAKKTKQAPEEEVYNKEDFIIRFPKEFFDNEKLNYNMSTKGANSLAQKE